MPLLGGPVASPGEPLGQVPAPNDGASFAGFTQCGLHDAQMQWRTVLYISAGVCLAGAAFYTALGSGEQQWWSKRHGAPGGRG